MAEEEKKKESEVWQRDYRAERKEEWDKIRSLGWKARIGYFWDYYKFVLVIIAGLIIAGSVIRTMIIGAMTDVIFELAIINSDTAFSDTSLLEKDFATYLGGLDKNEEIHIDSSMNIVENPMTQAEMMGEMKLTVYTASGSLDVCLLPEKLLPRLQPSGIFLSLDTLLSEEEKEKWLSDLVYAPAPVDYEDIVVDESRAADDGSVSAKEPEKMEEPKSPEESAPSMKDKDPSAIDNEESDSTAGPDKDDGRNSTGGTEEETNKEKAEAEADKEKAEEEIYGVRVDGDGILDDYISYSQSPVCFCIVASTVHEDTALEFLRFLKGEKQSQAAEASS